MEGKVALITGVTGQDGSYLLEYLLGIDPAWGRPESEYRLVVGVMRRSSNAPTARIEHIFDHKRLKLVYADVTDHGAMARVVAEYKPTEIYNLAAMSHVGVSFSMPQYTFEADAGGVLALLEAVRAAGLTSTTRIYQASTSELFGSSPPPQNEGTPMIPQSPYAVAKLAAFHSIRLYREAYGMHASNGILFNHESPRRGITFVTRKIARAAAAVAAKKQECLEIGNLAALRDWGHARDFVRAQYMIVQHEKADDFALGTDVSRSVREFCELCFEYVGLPLTWKGTGKEEVGEDPSGRVVVRVNERYFRPAEVESLRSDSSRAREILGWKPEIPFEMLVKEMMDAAIEEYGPAA